MDLAQARKSANISMRMLGALDYAHGLEQEGQFIELKLHSSFCLYVFFLENITLSFFTLLHQEDKYVNSIDAGLNKKFNNNDLTFGNTVTAIEQMITHPDFNDNRKYFGELITKLRKINKFRRTFVHHYYESSEIDSEVIQDLKSAIENTKTSAVKIIDLLEYSESSTIAHCKRILETKIA